MNESSSDAHTLSPNSYQQLRKRKLWLDMSESGLPSAKLKSWARAKPFELDHQPVISGEDGHSAFGETSAHAIRFEEEFDRATQSLVGGCCMNSGFNSEDQSRTLSVGKFIHDSATSASCDSSNNIDSWNNSHVVVAYGADGAKISALPAHGDIMGLCKYSLIEEGSDEISPELMINDLENSGAALEDGMLYSNGTSDFSGSLQWHMHGHGAQPGSKKLTIDQEFEQYFAKLMV